MKRKESNGNSRFRKTKSDSRPVLVTGGCGFIGTNLASRFLSMGQPVHIFDNLSRPGVQRNLDWLRSKYGKLVHFEIGDVRDYSAIKCAVDNASQIFHFAAQVAVTTSIIEPIFDFQVNIQGTLNILEAIRTGSNKPPSVFTSTNKVYGDLKDILVRKKGVRYEPIDSTLLSNGVNEERHLNFHSPYGCSKGAADQYILDYARTYSIQAVVFRMSCTYGLHQMGNEDQGWVAHFVQRAVQREPVTIYGDGSQVRDCLFVDDLVTAFLIAQENMDTISGEAFNMGGGPENTMSLLELIHMIEELRGEHIPYVFGPWRAGDQRYYVSDTTKFQNATGWKQETHVQEGVTRLYEWLVESHEYSSANLFTRKVAI
jgi:CDP-paratose 2-epimerase